MPDTVIRDGDRIEYGPAFFLQSRPKAIPQKRRPPP